MTIDLSKEDIEQIEKDGYLSVVIEDNGFCVVRKMIQIFYLCDVGSYSSCNKASCSRKKGGFCSHTMFREYSKNWKDAEPTTNELTLFFKYQAGSYWEQEAKGDTI